MSYPGGKAAMGAAQNIINQMPPHETYVELFAGNAAVWRQKRAAKISVLVEKDAGQAAKIDNSLVQGSAVICGCALEWLRQFISHTTPEAQKRVVIYADPPYWTASLKSRQRYRVKFNEWEHQTLILLLRETSANVILSGYNNPFYENALHNWRTYEFSACGRDGKSHIETLWMNFAEPKLLHDYRFLGRNFREREVIRRRLNRTAQKINHWPKIEQAAVIARLIEQFKQPEF